MNSFAMPESLSGVDLGVIDSLKSLKQEADVLRGRLSGLEAVKADFDPAVFSRVQADYAARAAALDLKAEPLRQQARDAYARLRGVLGEIAGAHEAIKLDRQEIELRHKLGEFDAQEFAERVQAIETTLAERETAHKHGESLRSRFLEVFANEEELVRAAPAARPKLPPTVELIRPDILSPSTTQEMPAVLEPTEAQIQAALAIPSVRDVPMVRETPSVRDVPMVRDISSVPDVPSVRDIPTAETQILQVLKLPDPPRVPPMPPIPGAPAEQAVAPTFGPNATMSLRMARLVPQNPEAGRSAIPLPPKPVSLGADSANEIRIGGPGVEPKHAQITVDGKGYTLSDLGSNTGTRVNAEVIQQRLLHHEDVIQIGMARFVFREG